MRQPIDFVMIWVDGGDPKWQKEKQKYLCPEAEQKGIDVSAIRYQDWDNLQYWFRGVEKFAPWVRKIHFITCGHTPSWLNTDHPKLNFIKHSDYIPNEYLPTFNANPIELNFHRINELSEQFVYFNDDMFLTAPVNPEDFFKNGIPRDCYRANAVVPENNKFARILFNNVACINQHFEKRKLFKQNFVKWFHPVYGKDLLVSFFLLPWRQFTGFHDNHVPNAFLKSSINTIWEEEPDLLATTSSHRFRSEDDVSQYLFRYWRLASGDFIPRSPNFGKCFEIKDNNDKMYQSILKKKYRMICCNDTGKYTDFDLQKKRLIEVFQKAFPEKSSFEK